MMTIRDFVGLGNYVYERRLDLGMSQKALAEAAGLSTSYLSDIEHLHRDPSLPETIERLANTLNVNADILYFYAGKLAPDMFAEPASEEAICAAYAAMRKVLSERKTS